jgi:SH3-like domain-containing protein
MLLGTELICLESKAAAKTKLGVNGQWIKVQDPNGDQGYVAAWYVSDVKGQPASPSVGTPASPTRKLPPGALAFVPTAEVAFRTQKVLTPETVIRYIPVTEQLVSIEPANQAIPKVGKEGEWLRVKDASGKEGYVAAKFVKYASGSTVQQQTAAATTMSSNGGPLKVRATAEGIALRSQPIVSDATLIKRLPLGTEFTVLEPNAASKIGLNDQWIRVKDPTGTEGVVAAWFVAR